MSRNINSLTKPSFTATLLLISITLSPTAQAKPAAIAVSGGISAMSNHGRYYRNIDRVKRNFNEWEISNLVADGPSSNLLNSLEYDADGDVKFDNRGLPILERLTVEKDYTGPANYQAIEKTIRASVQKLKKGEPILLYFTDHGGKGTGLSDRVVELWGEELHVSQLRDLMQLVPEDNPLIMMNDQCYGGGMLEALWQGDHFKKNACGFSASSASQVALNSGGLMETVDSICKNKPNQKSCTFNDIYEFIKQSGNWIHDSTPVSSSDLFLHKFLEKTPQALDSLNKSGTCIDCKTRPIFANFQAIEKMANTSLATLLNNRLIQLEKDIKSDCSALQSLNLLKNPCGKAITQELMQDVQKKKQEEEAKYAEIENALKGETATDLRNTFNAWMKHDHPETYNGYLEKKKQIDTLTQQIASNPENHAFDNQLAELKTVFKTLKLDYDLHFRVIDGDVKRDPNSKLMKQFSAFKPPAEQVGNNDPVSKLKSPALVLRHHDELSAQLIKERKNIQPLMKLHDDLTTYGALNAIISSRETDALTQYLGILDCENQPINHRN